MLHSSVARARPMLSLVWATIPQSRSMNSSTGLEDKWILEVLALLRRIKVRMDLVQVRSKCKQWNSWTLEVRCNWTLNHLLVSPKASLLLPHCPSERLSGWPNSSNQSRVSHMCDLIRKKRMTDEIFKGLRPGSNRRWSKYHAPLWRLQ